MLCRFWLRDVDVLEWVVGWVVIRCDKRELSSMLLVIELLELKLDESGFENVCIGCWLLFVIYKEGGVWWKRFDLVSLVWKRGGICGGGWKCVI